MRKKVIAAICSVLIIFSNMSVPANATQNATAKYSGMYVRTGDKATDIVNIALAQTGKKKADFGYTEAWCADFVSDCAILAGASDAIPQNGKVSTLYNAVLAVGGTEVTVPQKGDLVFYYCSYDGYVHVGIMVDSQKSIEGNYSSKVTLVNGVYRDGKGHSLVNGAVLRKFVRPAYNGAITPAPAPTPSPAPAPKPDPVPTPTPVPKSDPDPKPSSNTENKKTDSDKEKKKLKFSKKGAGDYKVATESSPLTLRKEADTSSAWLGSIPKGTIIKVTKTSGSSDDSWAYTSYKGMKGYVSMQFLTKVKTTTEKTVKEKTTADKSTSKKNKAKKSTKKTSEKKTATQKKNKKK